MAVSNHWIGLLECTSTFLMRSIKAGDSGPLMGLISPFLRVLGIATAMLTNLHQQIVVMHSHMFLHKVFESQTSCQTGFGKVGVAHREFATLSHKSTTTSQNKLLFCMHLTSINAYLRHRAFFNIGSEIHIIQRRNFTN